VALAIRELEGADQEGLDAATVKWRLIDLYCDTGQPDHALDLLSRSDINDPNLDTGPGTSAFRQGRVNFLLGNYENAEYLWERAIWQTRLMQAQQALGAAMALPKGAALAATRVLLELPGQIQSQARWEFELALCLLEAGKPRGQAVTPPAEPGRPREQADPTPGADDHFLHTLGLAPRFTSRPVVAYYLDKLGRKAPPPPAEESPRPSPPAASPEGPPTLPDDVFAPGPIQTTPRP
jgi:tetratricopeptide (TPR) repeat protein